jgi:lipopolysaccharide transport system permease protein
VTNTTRISPGGAGLWIGLADLVKSRDLLFLLARRDVRLRYVQTLLGVLWVVAQPLAATAVYYLVFFRFAGLAPDGNTPYGVWALAGLVPWLAVAQAVERSSNSLVSNQTFLTKVYFPRLAIPVASALAVLVDFALGYLAAVALVLVTGGTVSWKAGLGLPIGAAGIALGLSAGLWSAALNVRYRDVRHIMPFLVQIWFFCSPVVYPLSRVPETYRRFFRWNPAVAVVEGVRWSLLEGAAPPPEACASAACLTVLLLFSGAWYFARAERWFADWV